jgi:hypothetical protein
MFYDEDEGGKFQNMVRKKCINSTYLLPKDLIFESLRAPIVQCLKSQFIDFSLGHALSRQDLEDLSWSSANTIIWCASSFGLLKALDASLASRCISGTRHMHIALYSIPAKSIYLMKERLGYLPTEVLYLDSEVPELNRLSFLDYYSAIHDLNQSSFIVIAEYFTDDKAPPDGAGDKIKACLERQFSSPVHLVGQVYGRPMHMLDNLSLHKATNIVRGYASDKGIHIPSIYYSPINMAKCAMIAKDFILEP